MVGTRIPPGSGEKRTKVDETLALLVADDPRRQALRLLDHVTARTKAKAAAVITVADNDLASFIGEVPLARLAAVQRLWKATAKELRAGRSVAGEGCKVLPLMDARALIGLVFVEGAAGVEASSPDVVALAAALKAARERPVRLDGELGSLAGADFERRRLVAALERHEWNIARVARLIGVTRRTIYLRLKRYKIDRRRVPKTLKVWPVQEV
jgi:Bacterial regulatory protein, Fis family